MADKTRGPLKTLTKQHKAFCQYYVETGRVTDSARRAGYKGGYQTLAAMGSRLLKEYIILEEVGRLRQARAVKVGVSAEVLLHDLMNMFYANKSELFDEQGVMKSIHEWPEIFQRMVSSYEAQEIFEGTGEDRQSIGIMHKAKFPAFEKIIQMIGEHIDIKAWSEKQAAEAAGETFSDILSARKSYAQENKEPTLQ